MEMDKRLKRGFALLLAVMMIVSSAVMLASCGKSDGNEGSGSETESSESSESSETISENEEAVEESSEEGDEKSDEKSDKEEYNTTTAFVTDKCYVLAGMAYENEKWDEELIKEMFDIRDITQYMSIYFKKGGEAYVSSLLYGDKVQKGKWGEASDGVTLLKVCDDVYEIKRGKNKKILKTLSAEEDGEGFLLTLKEVKKAPEPLKKYVK